MAVSANRGNISAWAIRNPVPVVVLFILLTVAGLVSFPKLRINNTPDIDLPAVTVTVAQPGAAPSELETQVTRRVEDAVSGLGDVKHITSTVSDGVSTTVIEFNLGQDVDRAVNDVRDNVTQIRQDLPADVEEPIIRRIDVTGGGILTYTVGDPARTPEQLSWFIDDTVSKALLAVPGVSQVNRVGGVDREIRVHLDPDRLMALGITAADVSDQLRSLNVNSPGGRGRVGGGEQSIRTLGSAPTVEELRARPIALPGGREARLDELGRVEDATAEQRQLARLDNKPVVAFEILRTTGSSEVHVAQRVEARLAELRKAHPQVEITKIATTVQFVEESFKGAQYALLEGGILAVIVVFLFLWDWRATLISALAMPLSLIPTFAAMLVLGISLSSISLLALSLVIGVLVDDAIVEIENIVRHIRMGKSPYRAALEAADEIGLAVVATTLALVAVFLPVAFMPGIPGQFFFAFGVTVVMAVLFSLLVARLLTPLLGAYFLKFHPERVHRDSWMMRRYLALLRWCLDWRVRVRLGRVALTVLSGRAITLLAGIAIFAGSLVLASKIPGAFIEAADISRSTVTLELAPGATVEQTDAVAARAADLLRARPEVVSVFTSIGTSTGGGAFGGSSHAGDPRSATLTINLKPKTPRLTQTWRALSELVPALPAPARSEGERELGQLAFEAEMRPVLAELPGVRVRFGAEGGGGSPKVGITLVGEDPRALDQATQELERQMRTLPAFPTAASTASLRRPELQIEPMSERAAELGVSVTEISQTAYVATLGGAEQTLAKFNLPTRQIPIRVQLEEGARGDLQILGNLRVRGNDGVMVPLSSVATIRFDNGPTTIQRFDRQRKTTVEAELGDLALGTALEQIRALPIMLNLPPGVEEREVGDAEVMAEIFSSFTIALGAGVLLVYTVLVVLFRGFLQPVTIMTALPLSVGGAMALLWLTDKSLGISAVIGVLMLMGIVAKNSILLVEYAIEEQRAGIPRTASLMDAAHKRAQPIVMTTIAMIAGMMPIALGLGADAEFRSPMAICVVGGLITSTLLSLVFVPVVYSYMDGLQRFLGGLSSRLLTSGPQDADPAGPPPALPAPAE